MSAGDGTPLAPRPGWWSRCYSGVLNPSTVSTRQLVKPRARRQRTLETWTLGAP